MASAAVALLVAHGATPEDAERFVSAQKAAGLLIDPAAAEELLEDCRAQAAAEQAAKVRELAEDADTRVEALVLLVNHVRDQLRAARETVEQQQEELSALRPPHRPSAPRVVEDYPGELAHLRELLRGVCRLTPPASAPAPDATSAKLLELVGDHYSDSRMVDATPAENGGGRS